MLNNRIQEMMQEFKEQYKENEERIKEIEEIWKKQQEQLKDEKDLSAAILDNIYEAVMTINPLGIVLSYNQAAQNIFGYTADEVIGQNVKILMPEPFHSEHDGYLQNYMQTGKAKIIGIGREVEGRRKDGEIFPLFLAVTKIQSKDMPIFVGVVRDLSEQKRLEKLKNEFISTVSHELRTPLTSISGSLNLIESGAMGEVGEKIKPLIKIALNNSERLILLINDILDMEKIESGQMDFELEDAGLNSLLQEALEFNQGYADKHNVTLSLEPTEKELEVYVDKHRMQQVMSNLISNAAKFSPAGETVTIKVIPSPRRVRVEVHDNGSGIPQEFKKSIFNKFAQADASDAKQKGGTGLGLNITKAIIERFGGTINFRSNAEEGTTFYFDLPLQSKYELVNSAVDSLTNVLIVEDDFDIANVLKTMLENEGLHCDVAYNTKEAKKLLATKIYELMTLDIMLPQQDGVSFLEELRDDERHKDLSVIVISAKDEKAVNSKLNLAIELVDWINKPIDKNKLVASLAKAINLREDQKPNILHVEDDQDIAQVVKTMLHDIGNVDLALDIESALNKINEKSYDLIILDMMLPDGSGEQILQTVKERVDDIPVVIFSALDVDNKLKSEVKKALVKSRTSNTELVANIKKILHDKGIL
jgi:PAS domain S-box-containing protein